MGKDIPIIFSGPMVRALLAGRKTMTRRILKKGLPPAPELDAIYPGNTPTHAAPYFDSYRSEYRTPDNPQGMSRNWCWWTRDDRQCLPTINVRFAPGDRLWVRENFAHVGTCDPGFLTYQATYPDDLKQFGCENVPPTLQEAGYKWKPSIHMPRALSRLTLVVTGVKIERVQDITDAEIISEGVMPFRSGPTAMFGIKVEGGYEHAGLTPRESFMNLWCTINGPSAWNENPFVVAIAFRVIRANIDAPEARAA